jgi:hypothetical protein
MAHISKLKNWNVSVILSYTKHSDNIVSQNPDLLVVKALHEYKRPSFKPHHTTEENILLKKGVARKF